MTPAINIALAVALGILLVAALITTMCTAVWHVVYYTCRCRRNPIGKTALLTAAGLWLISAALVAVL